MYHRIFFLFIIQKHTRACPDITLDSLWKIEISSWFGKKYMARDVSDHTCTTILHMPICQDIKFLSLLVYAAKAASESSCLAMLEEAILVFYFS